MGTEFESVISYKELKIIKMGIILYTEVLNYN